MADPFVGEIRMLPFNFAPKGWASCNGQLLPLAQNTALYSVLGTTYGGDGKSNFALPDLRGRAPLHPGQGTGLTARQPGESGGSRTVALTTAAMPAHSHRLKAVGETGNQAAPPAGTWAAVPRTASPPYGPFTNPVEMHGGALGATGGSEPHNNMQPYLTVNFCIALQGIYPPRP